MFDEAAVLHDGDAVGLGELSADLADDGEVV